MRFLAPAFLSVVALAACAAVTPAMRPSPPPVDSASECSNAALGAFVGQKSSAGLGTQMLAASGATTLRWVRMGEMVTMEFNPRRLTVRLTADGRVASATCG